MKYYTTMFTFLLSAMLFHSCKESKTDIQKNEIVTNTETDKKADPKYLEQTVDDALADKIKKYLVSEYLSEGDLRAIQDEQRIFQLYKTDLNEDGKDEVFVNFGTPYFCGSGGCTVLLLSSDLKLITNFSPTQTLYVEDATENNWKVLLTEAEGSWRKLVFKNNTYPSNPTLVEKSEIAPKDTAQNLFNGDGSDAKTYTF